jgi:hypothetical protein
MKNLNFLHQHLPLTDFKSQPLQPEQPDCLGFGFTDLYVENATYNIAAEIIA